MKLCPLCRAEMSDVQSKCPSCNVDYFDAAVQEIAPCRQPVADKNDGPSYKPNPKQALEGLDKSFRVLDDIKLPTVIDTLRKIAWIPCMAWSAFSQLSGWIAKSDGFYVAGVALLAAGIYLLYRSLGGKTTPSGSMMVINTAQRILTADGAELVEEFAGDKQVSKHLDDIQKRIDDAIAKQKDADKANVRKITIWMVLSMLLIAIGVGVLAVHNREKHEAQVAYQMQPEWEKARNSYLANADQGEQSPHEPRLAVLRQMVAAQEVQVAEEFFFAHCQGKMGDTDCALCVINHYDNSADEASLNGFIDRLRLRYDSDTRKLQSRKSRKK